MPLWITENGLPDRARSTPEALADEWRVAFLRTHLEALGAALADGA
jgi:beta-glucosidase/6-phospho-beta-glucosidase/beta-galactosidase